MFEVSTRASEISGTFSVAGDELSGDKPRQFVNLENAMRCAVVDHDNSWRTAQGLGAEKEYVPLS